jgi:hypothetical protein
MKKEKDTPETKKESTLLFNFLNTERNCVFPNCTNIVKGGDDLCLHHETICNDYKKRIGMN